MDFILAPSDEALIHDICAMKTLGFNMLRKHGKIEADRWYFHCDRMGMLVWQDMPNGGSDYQHWFVTYLATLLNWTRIPVKDVHAHLLSRTDEDGRQEYIYELRDMIKTLYNHPSIVTWIPFNEGWGQFSTKKVTDFIHRLDPSRLVDSASGWFDQDCGDINSRIIIFWDFPSPDQSVYLHSLNSAAILCAFRSTVPAAIFMDIRTSKTVKSSPTASSV